MIKILECSFNDGDWVISTLYAQAANPDQVKVLQSLQILLETNEMVTLTFDEGKSVLRYRYLED